jgi:hypothetical protein
VHDIHWREVIDAKVVDPLFHLDKIPRLGEGSNVSRYWRRIAALQRLAGGWTVACHMFSVIMRIK